MFSSIAPLAYELAPVSASEDLLAKNRDLTIPPGRDFFHYANGSWLAQHPIPIEEAGWGIGNLVEEDLYQKLRQINETAAAQSVPTNREMQQIGDFWRTAMDEERATRLGVEPLQAELASIAAAQTLEAIIRVSFDLRPVG
ncbi:MAG TPA: M13 family peptidase, partial [Verrucomicrobiae bacterium]